MDFLAVQELVHLERVWVSQETEAQDLSNAWMESFGGLGSLSGIILCLSLYLSPLGMVLLPDNVSYGS